MKQIHHKMYRHFISFIIVCTWAQSNSVHGLVTVISRTTNKIVVRMKSETAIDIDRSYKVNGGIIPSIPSDSCSSLISTKPTSMITNEYEDTWVLLSSRDGDCSFNTKIVNAQNSGFSAIIIYNNDNTTRTMPISPDTVDNYYIFACFVSAYDGYLLKNNYTYEKGYEVQLSADPQFTFNWWLLLVMALCIAILIMVGILLFRLAWYFSMVFWERITGLREDLRRFARERRRSKRNKLFAAALKNIPAQRYHSTMLSESCAICTEEFFQDEEDLRVLSCNHGFHVSCINEWLINGRRCCPVCKRKVILEHHETFSNTDSETDDETAPLLSSQSSHNQYGNVPTSRRRINPFMRGNALNIQQVNDDDEDHEIVDA